MPEKDAYGKYHVTNEGGYITWYEFAKEIFAQAGMDVNVVPVTSDKFPAKENALTTAEWTNLN